MADYRAIAGVSRTLQALLRDRMEQEDVDVTLAPPDVKLEGTKSERRVNLYLFQVIENAALKNQEVPTQGHPGRYGHPPLSLDLLYLMTAHRTTENVEDADLVCQELLGDAMRVLHDQAIVTDKAMTKRTDDVVAGYPILDQSLLHQFEKIRISLEPAPLEDMTKIWSALPAANFRRGVVYRVSVVQIEGRAARHIALPVQKRRIIATTTRRPEILDVYREPLLKTDPPRDQRVSVGDKIVIEGHNFIADGVSVRLGDAAPITIAPIDVNGSRIAAKIPDDAKLQPGSLKVQVVTVVSMEAVEGGLKDRGTLKSCQRSLHSNLGLLQLTPAISSVEPTQGSSADLMTITGSRLYREGGTTYVLIGDAAIEVKPPPDGDSWKPPEPSSIQIPLSKFVETLPVPLPTGVEFPVRVQVNGVQNKGLGFTFKLMS